MDDPLGKIGNKEIRTGLTSILLITYRTIQHCRNTFLTVICIYKIIAEHIQNNLNIKSQHPKSSPYDSLLPSIAILGHGSPRSPDLEMGVSMKYYYIL